MAPNTTCHIVVATRIFTFLKEKRKKKMRKILEQMESKTCVYVCERERARVREMICEQCVK